MTGLNFTPGGAAVNEWLRAVLPELRAVVDAADRLVDVAIVASIEDPNEPRTAGLEATEAECLHREIVAVRAELAELRAGLQHEVRTERLVVVHPDDGRQLVYTDRLADSIGLKVCWHDDDPAFPVIEMESGCESDDLGDAGLSVFVGGNNALMIGADHRANGDAHGYVYVTHRPAEGEITTLHADLDGIELSSGSITADARFEVRS